MFFLWIILVPVILFVVYKEFKYAKIRKQLNHTPGKKTLPLVGNAHQVGKNPYEVLNFLFEIFYEFNHRNSTVWIGWYYHIVIFEPKDVEYVLASNNLNSKSDIYEMFEPWLGKGLLTSKGSKWRKHRKMITPSFHFKILQDFHETMNTNSAKFIEKLKIISKGDNIFDFQHMVSYLTLDVICDTAMGINVNAMEDPESQFVSSIAYLCRTLQMRIANPLKRKHLTYQFFPEYKKFCAAIKVIEGFTYDVIEKRAKARKLEEAQQANVGGEEVFQKRKMAFLDTLLSSTIDGRPLTHQEIYDEVSTFMFEGHDTTTTAVGFTVFLLSRHLGVQKKVFEEQKQMLGANFKRNATYQELADMKYLDLVIKESLRLYPSVPLIDRVCEKEFTMNGKIIPKDTTLAIFLMALGYNEKVFPDPYRFKPERFDMFENNEAYAPFEYVPFSAGPRNCIGQKFAQLEIKTVVSKIVRNFEILPALDELESKDGYVTAIYGPAGAKRPPPHKYDPKLSTRLTLKSDNGLHLRLRERPQVNLE